MSSEDSSWVLDSLVCFLHGPIWNAPLQTFIEEKSILFDPNLQTDEENEDVQKMHDEYKNLVDYMLGSFMDELQITPEQFEMACLEGRRKQDDNPFNLHQGLFQQIWAANDIKIFVRMMTQRNIELQLQALDLIEKNQLALLQEDAGDMKSATYEVAADVAMQQTVDTESLKYPLEVEQLIAKSLAKEAGTPDAAITPEQEPSEADVADKFQRLNLFFEKTPEAASAVDVQTRQEYLRQQRDKILEIKKKTRAKQLSDTLNSKASANAGKSERPTSALAAQRLLQHGTAIADAAAANDEAAAHAAMQLRKTLAKRLRDEVVEQKP